MSSVASMQTQESAVAYCRDEEIFYRAVSRTNYRKWRGLQVAIIAATGIGTIVAAVSVLDSYGWVRAIPVAFAAFASAMLAAFNYQADAIRQVVTAEKLRGERLKLETGCNPYDAETSDKNVKLFVVNVAAIIEEEVTGFGHLNGAKSSSLPVS